MKFKFTPLTVSVALGAITGAFANAYTMAIEATSAGGTAVTGAEWGQIIIASAIALGAVLFHDTKPQ